MSSQSTHPPSRARPKRKKSPEPAGELGRFVAHLVNGLAIIGRAFAGADDIAKRHLLVFPLLASFQETGVAREVKRWGLRRPTALLV